MDYKFIRVTDITGMFTYTTSSEHITLERRVVDQKTSLSPKLIEQDINYDYFIHFDGRNVVISKETYYKVDACLGPTWP